MILDITSNRIRWGTEKNRQRVRIGLGEYWITNSLGYSVGDSVRPSLL